MFIDDHFGKESIEVNVATKLPSEVLMKAADCMSFSYRPRKQIANKTWFDEKRHKEIIETIYRFTGSR